jgi:plastocyanin
MRSDGFSGGARASFAGLGLPLLLCLTQASSVLAADAKVGIDKFAFTPPVLTIKAGTAVAFKNHDDIRDLVVDAGGNFHSNALAANDSVSATFDKPGELAYFCGLHPHMTGKIIVAP